MYVYHYCVLASVHGDPSLSYNDGILESRQPVSSENYYEVREQIRRKVGSRPGGHIVVLSLSELPSTER